jgi:integrase
VADYLQLDGKKYKYIRGIPKDLQAVLGGKKFWTAYIGTMPHAAALAKARVIAIEHDKLIEGLWSLTKEQRAEIARTVVYTGGGDRSKLSEATRAKLKNTPAKPSKSVRGLDAWTMKEAHNAMALKFIEAASGNTPPALEALLHRHGLTSAALARHQIEEPTPIGQAGKAEIALAQVEANTARENMRAEIARDRIIKRAVTGEGDYALTPLASAWGKNMSEMSARRMHSYVKRFVASVGDLGPTEITSEHICAYRDALHGAGKDHAYVKDQLAKLHSLFAFGVSKKVCPENPVRGVKADDDVPRAEAQDADELDKGFTAKETQTIFAAMKGESEDFQWVTRIVAYHGCRSGEAAQLRCADITEAHGVAVMRINGKDGKRIKNRQSWRVVPLHPKIRASLIAFAKRVAKEHGEDAWLFQTSYKKRHVKAGPAFWYQQRGGIVIRRSLGFKSGMHRLRHRFISLCRELDMPPSVSTAITGHSPGKGEHFQYGGPPSLAKRLKWITKVDPLRG